MASVTREYNTFVKGIITEASPLTFPENASIDEENFILNRDGSRQRRLGMDYESGYALSSDIVNTDFKDLAVHTSEWRNADNSALNNMAVVQIGTTIYFYDLSSTSLSSNQKAFTIDLTTYKTAYASNIGSKTISTTVGKGILYVVSQDTNPFYITYDSITDTISVTLIALEQRDFMGLDDGYDVTDRPTTLTPAHEYNLLNQGWTSTNITAFYSSQGVYPSNADIMSLGKDASDNFSPALLVKQFFGNSPAPKGHFIIDSFTRDRTTISGVATLTTELEQGRPAATAFYAGRIFYAGVESNVNAGPTINGNIYFSQSLVSPTVSGKAYQDADPTSENISDLIDTDGGILTIPEIGRVYKLETVRDSLVVFADNGVWQIKGDVGGFSATSYQVQKISFVGAINADSIVAVESVLLYWSASGIYAITADTNSGLLNASNITQTTIQTLYLTISSVAKLYCRGSYDVGSKRISWLYNDSAGYDGVSYRYKYDTELVFDTVLQAFSKNTISSLASNSPYIAGVVTTPDLITAAVAYNVVVNGVQVQASAIDVQDSIDNPARGVVSTKYLCVEPQVDGINSKVTWGLYNDSAFLEWQSSDSVGIDFTSFLRTGHELFQDTMRKKFVPYLVAHFKRTETGFITNAGGGFDPENPSGCQMQAKWGWSDSDNSGRWSNSQQLYRLNRVYVPTGIADTFDYGFEVISTKSKVRGKGKAISFHFTSEAGKDMHLLGWGIAGLGAATV